MYTKKRIPSPTLKVILKDVLSQIENDPRSFIMELRSDNVYINIDYLQQK